MGVKGDRAVWEAEKNRFQLISTTIGELFDRTVAEVPDREALVYNYPELGLEMRLNFRQYRDMVDQLAKGLLALGIQKGEHVAVWAPNLPQYVFLEIALARIGAVMVTVNTTYKTGELEYVLRQGDVTTLFMVEEVRGNSYLEAVYSIAPELKQIGEPAKEILESEKLPRLKRVVLLGQTARPGALLFNEVMALGAGVSDEELAKRKASVTPEDVAVIMYTSGTTGFPKGAMLTHNNVLNDFHISSCMGNVEDEIRYVTSMPFFHIAGYSAVLFCLLRRGTLIPLVFFDPAKQLDLFGREKANFSFCVPTMLIAMLNNPRFLAGEFDLSTLKYIWSGAAPVPVVVMEQIKEKWGADIGIVFGLTETSGVTTQTPFEDSFELKASTVGIPMDHLDLKIINIATGEPVGIGESGELMVRGFNVMKGYYNMPEKTADTIDEEGWIHTGDLATMNAQGYVNIVGRVKDMIIRGGENIYPAEIEAFLMRHPKIAEAQAVGVPDLYMGEEMVTLLRLKPGAEATEEEIRAYCQANISRQKVPRYIRFVTEYPLTASGKVKKFELRATLIKELGLEDLTKVKTA